MSAWDNQKGTSSTIQRTPDEKMSRRHANKRGIKPSTSQRQTVQDNANRKRRQGDKRAIEDQS